MSADNGRAIYGFILEYSFILQYDLQAIARQLVNLQALGTSTAVSALK